MYVLTICFAQPLQKARSLQGPPTGVHGLGVVNLDSQNPCAGGPFRWLGRATETYFRFEVWASKATRHGFSTVSGLVRARRDSSLVLPLGRLVEQLQQEKQQQPHVAHSLADCDLKPVPGGSCRAVPGVDRYAQHSVHDEARGGKMQAMLPVTLLHWAATLPAR
jgi:hypothetical protein